MFGKRRYVSDRLVGRQNTSPFRDWTQSKLDGSNAGIVRSDVENGIQKCNFSRWRSPVELLYAGAELVREYENVLSNVWSCESFIVVYEFRYSGVFKSSTFRSEHIAEFDIEHTAINLKSPFIGQSSTASSSNIDRIRAIRSEQSSIKRPDQEHTVGR